MKRRISKQLKARREIHKNTMALKNTYKGATTKLVWFRNKLANSDDSHLVELSKLDDSQLAIVMNALSPNN